jgi:hypothetical protein
MKTILSLSILLLIGVTTFAKISPKSASVIAPSVLVVGFDNASLLSNYYGKDYLSEKIGVPADSIHYYYYSSIFEKLSSFGGPIYKGLDNIQGLIRVLPANQTGTTVSQNPNSGKLPNHFSELMKQYGSEYLLHFSQYQINWSGEPFNTIVHLVDYSLYDRNEKEILSGQIFFDSEDTSPFPAQKRAEKRMKQFIARIERVIK